jgi:hypothetical protein
MLLILGPAHHCHGANQVADHLAKPENNRHKMTPQNLRKCMKAICASATSKYVIQF